ncbi:tail assembly protein [Ewingella sp. AOP8-B2-18]
MTTIKLSGSLARLFDREHTRVIHSPKQAISALKNTIPGFEQFLISSKQRGLTFAIFKGKRNISLDEMDNASAGKEIHIVPVIIGSKRAGMFQTILGVALIAASAIGQYLAPGNPFSTYGFQVGAAMALGGVAQMLSPQTTGLRMRQDPDNKPSYAFGGPVNTTAQGNALAVGYGEREIGGAVISAGIYTEDQQ